MKKQLIVLLSCILWFSQSHAIPLTPYPIKMASVAELDERLNSSNFSKLNKETKLSQQLGGKVLNGPLIIMATELALNQFLTDSIKQIVPPHVILLMKKRLIIRLLTDNNIAIAQTEAHLISIDIDTEVDMFLSSLEHDPDIEIEHEEAQELHYVK